MNLEQITNATGLTNEERENLSTLVDVWKKKLSRNELKRNYYDAKNGLKNLGIAIPDEFSSIDAAVCWPAKAVDALANRAKFDGFVFEGDGNEQLTKILRQNKFKSECNKAIVSELVHSCVFVTVSRGDIGEPEVVVNFHTAESAAGLWDYRKKRLSCGFVVVDQKRIEHTDRYEPCWVNMYTDYAVIEIKLNNNVWRAVRKPHPMGRPMMEVLAYRPSSTRPFGKSRISRPVMSITDNAVRTVIRAELSSEFYTTPQKYLLGADDDAFDIPKWQAYIGSVFVAGKDQDGDVPQYGQLPQVSMQPHTDYMRSLAAQFAGATCIPISSLGVIHDNPSSADAIYAEKEDLVIEASNLNESNREALNTIAQMIMAIASNKKMEELTDDEQSVMANFVNPALPSAVSMSDAMIKQASVVEWLPETDVYWEELGYSEAQRRRIDSGHRRSQARVNVAQLMAGDAQDEVSAEPAAKEEPVDTKPAEVQGRTLNGAQTQSLLTIMAQLSGGQLTEGQAIKLISAAVGCTTAEARDIIEGNII